MPVEVFKTDLTEPDRASATLQHLQAEFRGCSFNFDLEDCDRILRMEAKDMPDAETVIGFLKKLGIRGVVLPDEVPSLIQ